MNLGARSLDHLWNNTVITLNVSVYNNSSVHLLSTGPLLAELISSNIQKHKYGLYEEKCNISTKIIKKNSFV